MPVSNSESRWKLYKAEVARLITGLPESCQLMAKLLYSSGLHVMECIRLRVKDVDFEQHQLIVRDGIRYYIDKDEKRTPECIPKFQAITIHRTPNTASRF